LFLHVDLQAEALVEQLAVRPESAGINAAIVAGSLGAFVLLLLAVVLWHAGLLHCRHRCCNRHRIATYNMAGNQAPVTAAADLNSVVTTDASAVDTSPTETRDARIVDIKV